ncbi:tyrosine-type recombinase/integrase [Halorubrum salinum]|uniref:tyrosine-type recombinase/integrase n=1 Tax=Halorubrum salinum TaxID=767517 RepID=UPI0021124299|nr:tyrosine-type recombinase/integrase [Halorubrum salinum]
MSRETPDFTPREAVDRWIDRQRIDKADQTVIGYRGRLKHFVDWSEENRIESMGELTAWDIESYETARRSRDLATITLRNEMLTFRQFLQYFASIGVVDEDLPEKVELPDVKKSEQTDDTFLGEDNARSLIEAFRNGETSFDRGHAFLELAWYTGARMGALRGLNLSDVDLEAGHVHFRHQPDKDTPLKNTIDGERVVGISQDVCDALRKYIRKSRVDSTDEYGDRPLFTTPHGRISRNAMRTTSYYATVPCRFGDCPHDKDRETCEFFSVNQASKCPSSRSPHQIRSGSITWQLNRGMRADVVSERVNASVDVIEAHYDQASPVDEFRQRRQRHLKKLQFNEEDQNE